MLKEISPEYSLEGLIYEAEAPIPWPPDAKSQLTRKDPDAGKDWGQEKGTTRWDGWMASLTLWTWAWAGSRRWWRAGRPGVLQSTGSQTVRHNTTEQMSNNNTVNKYDMNPHCQTPGLKVLSPLTHCFSWDPSLGYHGSQGGHSLDVNNVNYWCEFLMWIQ